MIVFNTNTGERMTRTILLPGRTSLVVSGSKAAFYRLDRTRTLAYIGFNGHGDSVFDLGRLPREGREQRLYLHEFADLAQDGASHRIYIAAAP